MRNIYSSVKLTEMAKALFKEERQIKRLDGWFIAKETEMLCADKYKDCHPEVKKAHLVNEVLKAIPLSLSEMRYLSVHKEMLLQRAMRLSIPHSRLKAFRATVIPWQYTTTLNQTKNSPQKE